MRHFLFAAGSLLLAVFWIAPAAAQAVPTVQVVQTATHPTPPSGWKVACMPNAVSGGASPTCPVLQFNGYTYWAWSDAQNAVSMAIVAYDANGVAVKQWNKPGARYLWNMTVDSVAQTVSFIGQSNATITMSWDDLFIPSVPGELTFVNVAAPAIACIFNPQCVITGVNDTVSNIAVPASVGGKHVLQSRTFPGLAQSPAAGKFAYLYRVDMSEAVSDGEAPCVTDLAVDFGPVARLSYDGTGQLYDAFVITKGSLGSVGLFSIVKTGNTVDFVFNQPVCAGPSSGTGASSQFFGIVSVFAPKAVTANVGWPGLVGIPTAATAPSHP